MIGREFGRLIVTFRDWSRDVPYAPAARYWECMCDCGSMITVSERALVSQQAQSCGCLPAARREHPRLPDFALQQIWRHMINRCYSPISTSYPNYGGRGIRVCERWTKSFDAFASDMGERPSPAHSIDRINNDGDYEPGNCRWATAQEQSANRRPARRAA